MKTVRDNRRVDSMSEMVDEDLLGGDELDDDYDITNEREEALLQDDEEYSKGKDLCDNRKKDSYSDLDEAEDDVLNLDIEEDFHDDDDTLYEEKEPCKKSDDKFSSGSTQRPKQNSTVNKIPVTKSAPVVQTNNTAPPKVITVKTTSVKNDKWSRGNDKRNMQTRPKYKPRRNGTVLINPRYEGTVHVNENNARLAWDNTNPQYPTKNTNMINPWIPPGNALGNANSSLVTNLVTEIVSLGQSSNMLLPQAQPATQNFYQPPPNNYQPQLSYEPPPNISQSAPPQQSFRSQNLHTSEWNNSYMPQMQVPNQQMAPPPQSSYYREPQQHFNQMSTNRMQGNSYSNYQSFNRPMNQQSYPPQQDRNLSLTSSYENKNLTYNRPMNKSATYNNNFSSQNNFQNKSVGSGNYSYQNKDFSYSSNVTKPMNFNYNPAKYENNDRNNFIQKNDNFDYKPDFKQNRNFSTYNKFQNNVQQNVQYRKDFNGASSTVLQANSYMQNKNFGQTGNRRPIMNEAPDTHDDSPEKKPKMNENVNNEDEQKKQTKNNAPNEDEEDEETRLYRLKIEEQKREREKILRIKEERRKQMILRGKQQDEDKLMVAAPEEQTQIVKQRSLQPPKTLSVKNVKFGQSAGAVSVQKPSLGNVRSNPAPFPKQSQASSLLGIPQQQPQYPGDSSDPSADMFNLTFKVSNNLQSSAPVVKDPAKSEASSSTFMSNRVVVVKGKNQKSGATAVNVTVAQPSNESSNESSDVGQGLSSFFNNRKVLKKDNNLLNTKLVVVNNLSTTINQNKLMALTRGIGEIQTLRVDKQERQATILFKSVASAHAFFKKYQRRILDDLSVIEVKLEPML